jgi:Bifunctional DNA primase/polymerase, N-terminal
MAGNQTGVAEPPGKSSFLCAGVPITRTSNVQHDHAPHCRATLESALALAAEGIAVFPLKYRSKEPESRSRGFYDATTNPAMIRRWFGGNFKRNLGARTGQASGVWVLDVDKPDALGAFEAQHGKLPLTRQSQSSRGMHLWFRAPIIPVQNSVGRVWPGIDTRGEGGYVAVPPSIHPSGAVYQWLNDAPIAEAPSLLLVRARKPPQPETTSPRPSSSSTSSGRPDAYAGAALKAECGILAAMPPNSGRNHQLNRAAFCLSQLVAGGELDAAEAERHLVAAATTNGLVAEDGLRSVMATIRSGAGAGRRFPRTRHGRGK